MTNLFMSGMSVLYKSCVAQEQLNGPLYSLNLNALTRFLRLQTTEMENAEPCEQDLLERYVSVDEAKLFGQYQNLF